MTEFSKFFTVCFFLSSIASFNVVVLPSFVFSRFLVRSMAVSIILVVLVGVARITRITHSTYITVVTRVTHVAIMAGGTIFVGATFGIGIVVVVAVGGSGGSGGGGGGGSSGVVVVRFNRGSSRHLRRTFTSSTTLTFTRDPTQRSHSSIKCTIVHKNGCKLFG